MTDLERAVAAYKRMQSVCRMLVDLPTPIAGDALRECLVARFAVAAVVDQLDVPQGGKEGATDADAPAQ